MIAFDALVMSLPYLMNEVEYFLTILIDDLLKVGHVYRKTMRKRANRKLQSFYGFLIIY